MRFLNEGTFFLFTIAFCSCVLPNSATNEEPLRDFIVTWGPQGTNNPFAFVHMPKTVQEATARGCEKLDDGCESPSLHYQGVRYVCNGSVDALPIYDKKGNVAGIQMALSKEIADEVSSIDYSHYPTSRQETIKGNDYYVLTGYFISPERICAGRSDNDVQKEGIATGIYIQEGSKPINNTVALPLYGDNRTLFNMNWIEGKCVQTMGLHYFLGLADDMSCTRFDSTFLMYDQKDPARRTTGFGYLVLGDYTKKPRYEFLKREILPIFVKSLPRCWPVAWDQAKGMTSFHVFFVNDPSKIGCDN